MKVVLFGEVMIRFRCQGGLRFVQNKNFESTVAGSEVNTGVLLSQLGIQCSIVSALPENDLGVFAKHQMQQFGLNIENIITKGERIGIYFVEEGNEIRNTEIIYDRKNTAFSILAKNQIDWNKAFENANLYHWSGISTAISESAKEACLEGILHAKKLNIPISCDFNYRKSLWYYNQTPQQIMPELVAHCDYVVADFDALEIYLGIKTNSIDSFESRFESAFGQIKEFIPTIKSLAMSFRKIEIGHIQYYGALAINNESFYSNQYQISKITDPIGTGDAFTGGLLKNILENASGDTCINTAVACGVLKQSIVGDWAIIKQSEIDFLINNGTSNRINR